MPHNAIDPGSPEAQTKKRRVKYRRKPIPDSTQDQSRSVLHFNPNEIIFQNVPEPALSNDLSEIYKQQFSHRIQQRNTQHGPWCHAKAGWPKDCYCQNVNDDHSLLDPVNTIKKWLLLSVEAGYRYKDPDNLDTSSPTCHSETSSSPAPPSLTMDDRSTCSPSPATTATSMPDVHFDSIWYTDLCRSNAAPDVVSSLANMLLFGTVSKEEQNLLVDLATPSDPMAHLEPFPERCPSISEFAGMKDDENDDYVYDEEKWEHNDNNSVDSDQQRIDDLWNCIDLAAEDSEFEPAHLRMDEDIAST